MNEVEVRTRIREDQRSQVIGLLQREGFLLSEDVQQTDITFDRPDASLFNSGCRIRIRRAAEAMELTYKGTFLERSDVSARTEINIRIDPGQFDAYENFLNALGYEELFRINKQRQTWRKGSVTATLDEWPIIGTLVELEGPEAEILDLAASLAPEFQFSNDRRLRDFFREAELESGKPLSQLQEEYQEQFGVRLGRLDLLAGLHD